MSITYEVFRLESFILEVWSGVVSIDDVRDHWSRLLQDEDCVAVRRTLADLRGATLSFSDQELLAAIQEVALPKLMGRDWVSAIVVRRAAQLHLASRYQGFALAFSNDAVFSHIEEAKRWLLGQQPPHRDT